MDIISLNEASTANGRIESFIENPDSTSGVVTVPKVIASGETITIPAGRVAILPNVQIDGVLNVENGGEVFIPSGATLSTVVEKVTSTDNAIVRFDGTTGAVQNSSVFINDSGNVGVGNPIPKSKFHVQGNIRTGCSSLDAVNARGIIFDIDGSEYGRLAVANSGSLLYIGTGGVGYGTGAGGTVTQLTSKSTAVTLNKPCGQITMNNSPLAAGASVIFQLNNTTIVNTDIVHAHAVYTGSINPGSYSVQALYCQTGAINIRVVNISDWLLTEALQIRFNVFKGADS